MANNNESSFLLGAATIFTHLRTNINNLVYIDINLIELIIFILKNNVFCFQLNRTKN